MPKKRVDLRIDNDLLQRAQSLCKREKKTLTQMITDALLAYVEKREHEIKKREYEIRKLDQSIEKPHR